MRLYDLALQILVAFCVCESDFRGGVRLWGLRFAGLCVEGLICMISGGTHEKCKPCLHECRLLQGPS